MRRPTPTAVAGARAGTGAVPDRIPGRTGRYDPVLLAGAAIVGALVVFYGADVAGAAVQAMARWLFIVVAETALAIFAGRVANLLDRADPARRFWRAFSIAGMVWAAGYAVQVVTSLDALVSERADPAALRDGPAATAALGVGTVAMAVVMLGYPLGRRSARERLCLWLDIATVLASVAAVGLYVAVRSVGPQTGPGSLALVAVFAGPVALMVATFGAVKLLVSAAPPFTRWAGALGAAGACLGGLSQGLSPMLRATGRTNLDLALQVVATALVVSCARVQLRQIGSGPQPARRRRPYSLLPYLAIVATYALFLVHGLDGAAWIVLGGAVASTGLVVARQVVAFIDNANLVERLDAKVAELNRAERVLRSALSERDALAEQLRQLAFYDGLTGLANRALFADRLDEALARRARHGGQVVIMVIDLDDFKPVNDQLGHEAGDAVLVEVAARLRRCLRTTDTVARIGGDEFAVLLDHPAPEALAVIAERVVRTLAAPYGVGGGDRAAGGRGGGGDGVRVGASVGVAVTRSGLDRVALMRRADAAMYAAKHGGKGSFVLVDDDRADECPDGRPFETAA